MSPALRDFVKNNIYESKDFQFASSQVGYDSNDGWFHHYFEEQLMHILRQKFPQINIMTKLELWSDKRREYYVVIPQKPEIHVEKNILWILRERRLNIVFGEL